MDLKEPEIKNNLVRLRRRYYSAPLPGQKKGQRYPLLQPTVSDPPPITNDTDESIVDDNEMMKIRKELSDLIKEGFKSEWAPEWHQNNLVQKLSTIVDKSSTSITPNEKRLKEFCEAVDKETKSTPTLQVNKKDMIGDLMKRRISPSQFFQMICHSWSSRF